MITDQRKKRKKKAKMFQYHRFSMYIQPWNMRGFMLDVFFDKHIF